MENINYEIYFDKSKYINFVEENYYSVYPLEHYLVQTNNIKSDEIIKKLFFTHLELSNDKKISSPFIVLLNVYKNNNVYLVNNPQLFNELAEIAINNWTKGYLDKSSIQKENILGEYLSTLASIDTDTMLSDTLTDRSVFSNILLKKDILIKLIEKGDVNQRTDYDESVYSLFLSSTYKNATKEEKKYLNELNDLLVDKIDTINPTNLGLNNILFLTMGLGKEINNITADKTLTKIIEKTSIIDFLNNLEENDYLIYDLDTLKEYISSSFLMMNEMNKNLLIEKIIKEKNTNIENIKINKLIDNFLNIKNISEYYEKYLLIKNNKNIILNENNTKFKI